MFEIIAPIGVNKLIGASQNCYIPTPADIVHNNSIAT